MLSATNKSISRLKSNIIFNVMGQGVIMILTLVSTRFVFKNLGLEVLGVIYFSMTVTALVITISDMGFSYTIIREIAAYRQKDMNYVTSLVGATSVLVWCAYICFMIIVVATAPLLVNKWLQISTIEPSTVLSFQIISASLLLAIPKTLYGSIISGYERLDIWNIANIITVGFQQLGLIFVLNLGGKLYHVAMWYALSGILGLLLFIIIAGCLSGFKTLRLKYNWQVILKNIRFGSYMFLNSIVGYFIYQIDRWIISKFLPVKMLGYYGVAQSLASKCGMVPGAIASAAFPTLSMGMENTGRTDWNRQYNKLQDFCSYVIVPVSAAVAMLGIVVISIVFNYEIVKAVWLPLIFLSVAQLLLGLQYIPTILCIAMKKPELSVHANIFTLIIMVPFAIFLTINYGLVGASLSAVIASISQIMFFIPKFFSKCFCSSSLKWYLKSGLFIAIAIGTYGLPWSIMWLLGMGLDLYGLVGAYIIGTILFLFGGWFVIGSELKQTISENFSRFRINWFKKTI